MHAKDAGSSAGKDNQGGESESSGERKRERERERERESSGKREIKKKVSAQRMSTVVPFLLDVVLSTSTSVRQKPCAWSCFEKKLMDVVMQVMKDAESSREQRQDASYTGERRLLHFQCGACQLGW